MATQPVVEPAAGKRWTPRRIGIDTLWDYAVLLTFVILFVALSIASPAFLTTRNLFNILDQSAPVGIIACAATLVIIAGGFDLSAGAIFASPVSSLPRWPTRPIPPPACSWRSWWPRPRSVQWSPRLGVPDQSLRGHLATGMMIRGLAVVITSGFLVTVADERYTIIGRDGFLGVKFSVWLFAVFAAICGFLSVADQVRPTSTPSAATPRPRASPASVSAG